MRNMKTILITQAYNPQNQVRKEELALTLSKNVTNKDIDWIVLLVNEEVDYKIAAHPKVKIIRIESRPRYSDLFENINLYKEEKCNKRDCLLITANSDIYFHEDAISQMKHEISDDTVMILSRWDHTRNGLVHFNRMDSQDVWAVKNRYKPGDYDIIQGVLGCDNRIAAELKKAGYTLSNPSLDIKSIHYHYEQYNTYSDTPTVLGEYAFIHPHPMRKKWKRRRSNEEKKAIKKRRY